MVKTQGSRSETTRSVPLTTGMSYLSGILNKLYLDIVNPWKRWKKL